MLRYFRGGGTAQVVVGGIVMAIIVVFALEFRAGRGGPTARLEKECAVDYDGYCIDQKDYFAAFSLMAPRGAEQKQLRAMALRQRVLDGLAERELLVAAAKREGVGVSDEVVEQELLSGRAHVSLPADALQQLAPALGLCRLSDFGNGCDPGTALGVRQLRVQRTPEEGFDMKLYEHEVRVLTNRGPKEFRKMQERELIADRMRALVQSRARVAESEAYLLYERGRSRAVIRSVRLERSWFAKFAVDHDDAAVQAWSAQNQSQVDEAWKADQSKYSAGCPIVREIMLALLPGALDDEKAPIKTKLTEAKERIAKGESFETLAYELSEAPSAALGGRIACLHQGYGMGADELLKAASALKEGEVSGVIETPRGLHLLKLEGKLDAAQVASLGRLAVARNLHLHFAADEAMKKFSDDLIAVVKSGNKLETATEELAKKYAEKFAAKPKPRATEDKSDPSPIALRASDHPKFEISPPFTISGNPLPDLDLRESVATKAFELKEPDEVYPKPISTATGLLVFQLKEQTPAKREDFEKEKWPILRALRQAKAADALTRYVA
ncbi:MAG TPA: peptidylprolyl isomerase, partial [Polyangiaceae bacterium]|nr:peptidylprolyl isomerase [Polyangiaceae bacterium]